MAVVRWVFEDPVSLIAETFEINPNEGGSPSYEKNMTYKAAAAAGGRVIALEGRDRPKTLEFSGTLLTQSQFEMFTTWWNKRYQVKVTDDLNREFYILIESFIPKRERAIHYPWKHSYTVRATVVDWPTE